jgi:hypothetical protein
MHRAKLLSKSFIASAMRLSCLRTNNELSLGELVHPKCIHFFKYFSHRFSSESHHTWIKLLNLWCYFEQKSSFCIFSHEIKSGKLQRKFFTMISTLGFGTSWEEPRGSKENRWRDQRWGPRHPCPFRPRTRLIASFCVPLYIPQKPILPGVHSF